MTEDNKLIKEPLNPNNFNQDYLPLFTETCLASCMCQECIIENYSSLKEKICYSMTQEVELSERTLKLYKTKKVHSFQFHCELTNSLIQKLSFFDDKMTCYIMYDRCEAVCPGELVETEYGYSIEVPKEVILDPANEYLHESDKLVIQFRYRHFFYSRDPVCQYGVSTKEDRERLSKDLMSLYKSRKFVDFAIIDGDDKTHFIHRSICRSRSITINNIDDQNVVALTVQSKSRHVEIAIEYMYSGILPQLPLDDLLQVVFVAEDLDIESLILSLQLALLEILNKSNAEKIREVASKLNMYQLFARAEEYLPQERMTKKSTTSKRRKNRR